MLLRAWISGDDAPTKYLFYTLNSQKWLCHVDNFFSEPLLLAHIAPLRLFLHTSFSCHWSRQLP